MKPSEKKDTEGQLKPTTVPLLETRPLLPIHPQLH